jgi:hypothetical protein
MTTTEKAVAIIAATNRKKLLQILGFKAHYTLRQRIEKNNWRFGEIALIDDWYAKVEQLEQLSNILGIDERGN